MPGTGSADSKGCRTEMGSQIPLKSQRVSWPFIESCIWYPLLGQAMPHTRGCTSPDVMPLSTLVVQAPLKLSRGAKVPAARGAGHCRNPVLANREV